MTDGSTAEQPYQQKIAEIETEFDDALSHPDQSRFYELSIHITKLIADLMLDRIDALSNAFLEQADTWIKELQVLQLHVYEQIRLFEKPQNADEMKLQMAQKSLVYLMGADQNMDDVLVNLDHVISVDDTLQLQLQNDLQRLDLVIESTAALRRDGEAAKQQLKELVQKFLQKRRNVIIVLLVLTIIMGLSIWHLVWTLQKDYKE